MEVEPGIDIDMSVNKEPAAPQSGVIPTHLAEERQRRAGCAKNSGIQLQI
jgi:hypothetical protein